MRSTRWRSPTNGPPRFRGAVAPSKEREDQSLVVPPIAGGLTELVGAERACSRRSRCRRRSRSARICRRDAGNVATQSPRGPAVRRSPRDRGRAPRARPLCPGHHPRHHRHRDPQQPRVRGVQAAHAKLGAAASTNRWSGARSGWPSWRSRARPTQTMSRRRSPIAARSRPRCGADADVETVNADQFTGPVDVNVLLRAVITWRLVGAAEPAISPRRLARVFRPWRQSTFHTPLGETMIAPHFSRASCEAMRLGPSPGCAIEKDTMRSSIIFASAWASVGGGADAAGASPGRGGRPGASRRSTSSGAHRTSGTPSRRSCARLGERCRRQPNSTSSLVITSAQLSSVQLSSLTWR